VVCRPSGLITFRYRSELLVCCVQSWNANGLGRDIAISAGVLHAANRGLTRGMTLRAIPAALPIIDAATTSTPEQISLREPAPACLVPTTSYRVQYRYRAKFHGRAFRPSFRGSMAGLCAPLPTLRLHSRGCRRTARGRCGALLLAGLTGAPEILASADNLLEFAVTGSCANKLPTR